MDLRTFIEETRAVEPDEYLEVLEPLDVELQIAKRMRELDGGPIVLFKRPKGYDIPVVSNIFSKRRRFMNILKVSSMVEAYRKLLTAISRPRRGRIRSDAPFMEVHEDSTRSLPILKHYKRDGGAYMTTSIVIARDYELDVLNASVHRLQVLDRKRLVIRIVPRHLYRMYKKACDMERDLEVAIVIGCHPLNMLTASSSPPYGIFELDVANTISNNRLEVCELDNGLVVPREAEIVIVGRIKKDEFHEEGPFVDITGTYDIVRRQPVLEVERVLRRENPLYQALLPAGEEHKLLMGFYREALIWDYVRRAVPEVKAVRLSRGGCGWLHCFISIKKEYEGDAKNAILAAFAAHPSLKLVVVVDEDINIEDTEEVEWAIATRFQPSEDLVILEGVRGSSLDPSADQEALITSKLGIDATIPLYKPSDRFRRIYE
ncbi:MAG: UbiD family decarboxylase [Thermoprotei archaeon]|nr:MAG: UbiD family decarboxylase [Thermoprotei archaeon]